MAFIKLAAKRYPGYPIGQPAPMYLDCLCGAMVPIPYNSGENTTCCDCKRLFDDHGYILSEPKA